MSRTGRILLEGVQRLLGLVRRGQMAEAVCA